MVWNVEFVCFTEDDVVVGDIETAKQVLGKWGAFIHRLKASEFRSGVDDWCGRMQRNAFATMQGMLRIKTQQLQRVQNQAEHDRNKLAKSIWSLSDMKENMLPLKRSNSPRKNLLHPERSSSPKGNLLHPERSSSPRKEIDMHEVSQFFKAFNAAIVWATMMDIVKYHHLNVRYSITLAKLVSNTCSENDV